jgi:predicted MFS family arabinose efflux permease
VIFGTRVGLDKVALLFVFLALGGMVGSQFGGRLADRLGTTTPILSCLILGAVAIALANVVPGTIVPSAALVAVIASLGWALYPLQQARMIALAPTHAAVVVSLVNSAAYLGVACAAALGAATLARFSPFYMPYAAIGTLITAIALFAISWWILPPSAAAEPKASP